MLLEDVIRDGKLARKGGCVWNLLGIELRVATKAGTAAPADLIEAIHLAAVDGSVLRGVIVGHAGNEIRVGPNVLQCPEYASESAVFDYAQGIGEKTSPVEQARRRFSERIEEGDKVELADRPRGPNKRIVRAVRDGRVVALIDYTRGTGGGWRLESYERCIEFSTPLTPGVTSPLPVAG